MNKRGAFMKNFISILVLALVPALAFAAERPNWAYPETDKVLPPRTDDGKPKTVPGSTKSYTQAQMDDGFNPPDWFPDEHPPMPRIVGHGNGTTVRACTLCHLTSGEGHPESSGLAGLPVPYLIRQMADFKSGARKGGRAASITAIAKAMADDDVRTASEYFASLKSSVWTKVVETDSVPKSYVGPGAMRLPHPDGGTEPIGNRIIELPQDPARATSRDPKSGFIAYVPRGSIAKGEALVTTGGGGKTIACAICHGPTLKGLGEWPRIAGLSAIYVVRQLYDIQSGDRAGVSAELMKASVARLDVDDMIAIAAYVASREP